MLLLLLSAIAAATTAAAAATLPVVSHNGTFVGNLTLTAEDEPADVVYEFAREHALNEEQRSELLDGVCSISTCRRREAMVFQTEVLLTSSVDMDDTVLFAVPENTEPADAAHDFVTAHNLPLGYRNALLVEACAVAECTRTEPIVWRKTIRLTSPDPDANDTNEQEEVEITLLEGEEVADVIFNALRPYHVSREDRLKVMEAAKREGVTYSREYARLFSASANETNAAIPASFHLFDDGTEPIDALYRWTIQHGADADFDAIYEAVVPRMCAATECERMDPIVYQSRPISSAAGRTLGSFAVLRNEDPIDSVDYFAQVHGLDVLQEQLAAPLLRLSPHPIHQVRPRDIDESRKVPNLCCGHKLPPLNAALAESTEYFGTQGGPRCVDCRRVSCRAAPDDHKILNLQYAFQAFVSVSVSVLLSVPVPVRRRNPRRGPASCPPSNLLS